MLFLWARWAIMGSWHLLPACPFAPGGRFSPLLDKRQNVLLRETKRTSDTNRPKPTAFPPSHVLKGSGRESKDNRGLPHP